MHYTWQDILIAGDSFCAGRRYSHEWPQLLLQHLTGQPYDPKIIPRGHGYSGASWWSTRKCIIDEFNTWPPVKVLIVCHTDSHRIPSDKNFSLNAVSVERAVLHRETGGDDPMPERLAQAGRLYYEELINWGFNEWACQRWFIELDELIAGQKSLEKVIHLFCFDGNFYQFKQGVTVADTLIKHRSKNEISNHFDYQGNQQLAGSLAKILDNYPGNGHVYNGPILGE